jgi:hypothetical protein
MHHKQVDSSTSELTDRAMSWNESGSCKLSDNSSWQDFVDCIKLGCHAHKTTQFDIDYKLQYLRCIQYM